MARRATLEPSAWLGSLGQRLLVGIGILGGMLSFAWAQPPLPDLIHRSGFEAANQPPIANAGGNISAPVGAPQMLNGTGSFDPEGQPLSFFWRIISRPVESGVDLFDDDQDVAVLIADRPGSYIVELTVSDGELFSAPTLVTVGATGSLSSVSLIGPTGGAVGLPDGAAVLVPPAALDSAVEIGISLVGFPPGGELPPTGVLVGDVYQLSPSQLAFQRPVQLIVPYSAASLPAGYSQGSVAIYRQQSWPEFNLFASFDPDEASLSHGQGIDTANQRLSTLTEGFSAYAAIAVRSSAQFQDVTLTNGAASVTVKRPPNLRTDRPQHHNCRAPGGAPSNSQGPLAGRTVAQIAGVVVHSTNNGNVSRDFNSELGWAADNCNRFFTHYYINRNGDIYQVVDDLRITEHVGQVTPPPAGLGLSNANSIGIELFLNVGEPYDGRQMSALVRLTDFLLEEYSLARPQRDQTAGIVRRNRIDVAQGGDRVVSHSDAVPSKCDPSGTFMDSGVVKPEARGVRCDRVTPVVLSVGSSRAPALVDLLLDVSAVTARDRQHTGVINTHGGDSLDVAEPGDGGAVQFVHDPQQVDAFVGSAERTRWEENEPTLLGPGPLIVAPGDSRTLPGGVFVFTDLIVAGSLLLQADTEFHVTGSVYISPLGRIVARSGRDGASVSFYSRGTPVIQGLLDARGDDGVLGSPIGGRGGDVTFVYSAPGILLVPTIITRGGDVDTADVTLPSGGPVGGEGGSVNIEAGSSHVVLGGGVGPLVGSDLVPTWRSGPIDPSLFGQLWAADYLPPAPPARLSSFGAILPPNGVRVPLTWGINERGFTRGILTTGGMGGSGNPGSVGGRHGGPGGAGGNVVISADPQALLTFKDIDLITGAGVEVLTHRFPLPETGNDLRLVCPVAGGHGGFGIQSGGLAGNGGSGGPAGEVRVVGGVFSPAPSTYAAVQPLQAFPAASPLLVTDVPCSRGRDLIGQVVEARNAAGDPLYRLRLNATRTSVLGGMGGIPSGRATAGDPGLVGSLGPSAPVSGVPVQ